MDDKSLRDLVDAIMVRKGLQLPDEELEELKRQAIALSDGLATLDALEPELSAAQPLPRVMLSPTRKS